MEGIVVSNHKVTLKVFPMIALFAVIVWSFSQQSVVPVHIIWVAFGLMLSIVADTLSEFGVKQRRLSYVLFLAVFIFYSKSLWMQPRLEIEWWLPALLISASTIVVLLLLPRLDAVLIPVLGMGLLLIQMASVAGELWMTTHELFALLAFASTLLFMGSGLLLAMSRLHKLSFNANVLIHTGYYLAQLLMVLSILI